MDQPRRRHGLHRSLAAGVRGRQREAVRLGLALVGLFALACAAYAPALRGPFVSDDLHYVANNPFVTTLSAASLWAMIDPTGPAGAMVENWAPVHLTLHALAWRAFGDGVLGHHLSNLALHALGSLLLARLLRRSGASERAAWLGGALFLLHPANVEAVAWISQLKSSSALVLALAALLWIEMRPALATATFALALLAKPTAFFALPVAVLFAWMRRGPRGIDRRTLSWLVAWAAVLLAFSGIEFGLFQRSGQDIHPVDLDPLVRLRSIVANSFGYLVMSSTTLGLSTFHEPEPARSWLDARWLAGALAIAALGARSFVTLRAGRIEAAYWMWAAASFAPVSQIFPFLYPVADRYLYFVLPGLIGGVLLAAPSCTDALVRRVASVATNERLRSRVAPVGLALGVAFLLLCAVRTHDRARVWSNPAFVLADSARHYPDGSAANLLRARREASAGDARGAAASLRRAFERGFLYYEQIEGDPAFAALRATPEMQSVLRDMAAWWIDRIRGLERPTQPELALLARAHHSRGESEEALRALERAAAMHGPMDAVVSTQLREQRARSATPATR